MKNWQWWKYSSTDYGMSFKVLNVVWETLKMLAPRLHSSAITSLFIWSLQWKLFSAFVSWKNENSHRDLYRDTVCLEFGDFNVTVQVVRFCSTWTVTEWWRLSVTVSITLPHCLRTRAPILDCSTSDSRGNQLWNCCLRFFKLEFAW